MIVAKKTCLAIFVVLVACGSGAAGEKAAPGESCGAAIGVDCSEGAFCEYPIGDCGASGSNGVCKEKTEICAALYAPVCGCDSKTHSSTCHAAGAGVSIRAEGECPAPTSSD